MKQGPVGEVMKRLQGIGVPPMMLQMFQQVLSIDPKKFDSALEQGKLPSFMQAHQQLMAQMQGQPMQPQVDPAMQAEAGLKQAQAQKVMAETKKVDAEIALTMEQINSEKVDQQVKLAGVQFDKEKMTIERARTVADVEDAHRKDTIERGKLIVSAQKNRPGFNEQGLESDNQE
jgi:hypothetical protein